MVSAWDMLSVCAEHGEEESRERHTISKLPANGFLIYVKCRFCVFLDAKVVADFVEILNFKTSQQFFYRITFYLCTSFDIVHIKSIDLLACSMYVSDVVSKLVL